VNILSACCFGLGLLIGGCGVLSLRDHRTLIHRRFDNQGAMRVNMVASCNAALWLSIDIYRPEPGTTFTEPGWYFGPGSYSATDRNWWRPYYFHHTWITYDQETLVLPHWIVASLFVLPGLPFALTWRKTRRARWRLKHSQCPACGYDVRATPDHCPECGNSITIRPGKFEGSFSDGQGK
jgi:hypothetical protein